MPNNEMQPAQEGGLPALAPEEVRGFMLAAIEKGGIEAVERVAAMYERAQEKAAARAYHDALAQFASFVGPIKKDATASIATRGGANYSYSYVTLEHMAREIAGPLKACGLSYTWDSHVADGMIAVRCIVRHIEGHSEEARFMCPTDSKSAMSEQQKVAAALTFGRRQSLVQALGLTACDQDDDGADPDAGEPITGNQALDLEVLLKDTKADRGKFLKWLNVDKLEDCPASRFDAAVRALEQKARQ